jgi:hypothetical protein
MNQSDADKAGSEKSKQPLDQNRSERGQKLFEAYEAHPKACLFCGNKIPFEKRRGKFCNKSCSASFNNQGVTRHIKGSKVCSCGNSKLPQNKYCSVCSEKHVYHRAKSVEGVKTDIARKKLLLEIRGHRCEGCGLAEWRGQPITIELHHVDGNTDHNAEDNLQLLCPNCHSQSDTHRTRNKNGKRQLMRRKRYANGQTW